MLIRELGGRTLLLSRIGSRFNVQSESCASARLQTKACHVSDVNLMFSGHLAFVMVNGCHVSPIHLFEWSSILHRNIYFIVIIYDSTHAISHAWNITQMCRTRVVQWIVEIYRIRVSYLVVVATWTVMILYRGAVLTLHSFTYVNVCTVLTVQILSTGCQEAMC